MSIDNRSRFISAVQKNPAFYVFLTMFIGFIAGLDFARVKHAISFWDRYAFVTPSLLALYLSYRLTQTIIDLRHRSGAIGT